MHRLPGGSGPVMMKRRRAMPPRSSFHGTRGRRVRHAARPQGPTRTSFLLPDLTDRPRVMKRYSDGAKGEHFFMKRAPVPRPVWAKPLLGTKRVAFDALAPSGV